MTSVPSRIGKVLLGAGIVLWLLWSALTLWYANLQPDLLRQVLALAYLGWLLFAFLRFRSRRVLAVGLSGAVVTLAYVLTFPSNERDWLPEVAVAAATEIHGNTAVVHGVRNFRYRSEEDFDVVWEDRELDLDGVRTLDLFMSYWGPLDYCHTILSFGFEDGRYLAASVEVRKERSEGYSTFGGLFKRFELAYVFADERDVIALRTNHRHEDVYLYRLRADPRRLRELLVSYLDFANELAARPQFYGVLRNSCGVNILQRLAETGEVTVGTRVALLNGHWDRMLYERGAGPRPPLRGAARAQSDQRRGPGGRSLARVLRAHPRGPASRARAGVRPRGGGLIQAKGDERFRSERVSRSCADRLPAPRVVMAPAERRHPHGALPFEACRVLVAQGTPLFRRTVRRCPSRRSNSISKCCCLSDEALDGRHSSVERSLSPMP